MHQWAMQPLGSTFMPNRIGEYLHSALLFGGNMGELLPEFDELAIG
jgi:hypothetical protein